VLRLERWPEPLRRAGQAPPQAAWLRGDLRALPLREASFDAAWSWYASLFMWDEPANLAALVGAARVLRRGGRLLIQHANPLALALEPRAVARRSLPTAAGSRRSPSSIQGPAWTAPPGGWCAPTAACWKPRPI